ncbi:glutaredoxin family protein [Kangiella sp. HZ709]|uniref:glutaredoxin family protein n=1 Tax=Kangiella sp. HZ709 TaxID=2666328 RepID=UPI0012B1139E|nr:glutaredoxin family protein [Kangiella sp. HZ709]MRX28444.1 thioredoxin family protein [Kangiella sp. HZ709]
MQKIIFYTTFGCHLCETVEQMFSQFFHEKNNQINFEIEIFDIIDDEKIMFKYKQKIPVIKNNFDGNILIWPFDYQEFKNWLPH